MENAPMGVGRIVATPWHGGRENSASKSCNPQFVMIQSDLNIFLGLYIRVRVMSLT